MFDKKSLRKRIVSNIINLVLVKKLLIYHPRCIRNNFINPPVKRKVQMFNDSKHAKHSIVIEATGTIINTQETTYATNQHSQDACI